MTTSTDVIGLFVGQPKTRWAGKAPSAIAKFAANGSQHLIETGFTSDDQADKKVHGGADKAVHHYPADHYLYWQAQKFSTSFAFRSGGFGENVSTAGLVESDVCIGDVFELGSAAVQISQGRQPCWKLNMHTRVDEMAIQVQKTGKTGWYYRVLQQGEVAKGDKLRLVERFHETWPMDRLITARFDKNITPEVALEAAAITELAQGWRTYFTKRAKSNFSEDQSPRLVG